MGFGRAIVAALLVAAGASAAGNVSLVPSGFTSAEMVKRFHGFGGWHVEDRSCDKYVYGRLWDADCMKRRPPAGEILPLLVTGTPYTGTRSVAELFAAMDVEADHEAYADMATVSAVHAFNDFVGGVPYPRSSEQTPWWKTRIISNRYDYQNAFRPRWKHAVHLTRCPLRVVQRLMGAGAPVIRFLEAFTEWPRLRYRSAHERLKIESLDSAKRIQDVMFRLCVLAFSNRDRKPHHCDERVLRLGNATATRRLGRHEAPLLLARGHLERAVWPPGVDGPATLRAFLAMAARYGYDVAAATAAAEIHWDHDASKLREGPAPTLAPLPAASQTKRGIETCLASEATCDLFAPCPAAAAPRDCLRARVLFGQPYRSLKCCFRCCVLYWLESTRLGANIRFHAKREKTVLDEVRGKHDTVYNKANPDDGDYGLDPLLNLLAHPHAFAAISDVHVHPRKGCSTAGDLTSLNPMIASLYHYLPEKVITPEAIFDDVWRKNPHFGPCVRALREELYGNGGFTKQGDPVRHPTGKSVVVDFFDPGKWRPKPALLSYLALGTANNVANLPKHKPAYGRIRERVIGVRGVSLWHAFLEHPAVDARAATRDRLLLCCCMNVDGFHVGRLEHTQLLDRYAAFDCPADVGKSHHIHQPRSDPGKARLENEIALLLNGRYGTVKGMQGNYDTHMPLLMLHSKFVYSPNGIGEQCYREYEALVSGAIPLVDATAYDQRNALLRHLPVILVSNWSNVTPQFLERAYATMSTQSFDVSHLYLPFWYDVYLTALGYRDAG
ncbi:hypothetical protein JL722_12558 [Aureococcus anophagefferens]|nr:hypothetical protein JL722_12558 [Aureococcus anophagefferens]